MKEKIKEFRKIIPVPMAEAIVLLKDNEGDVNKCVSLFREKSIRHICELTGCSSETAEQHYEAEKFDFNRTVSSIKDIIYDQNYTAIDGLTKDNIRIVMQWLSLIEAEDFATSLDFKQFDAVAHTFSLIPVLSNLEAVFRKAKDAKEIIFEGYSDDMVLDEFVRRHKRLDDDAAFQEANKVVSLSLIVIKEELLKHLRNL